MTNDKIVKKDFSTDESGLMRAHQLKSGMIQRTDTASAERLMKEFGSDIRYNAFWKNRLVWNERQVSGTG